MKTTPIKQLIKHIVKESLDMLEAHEAGSAWITDDGQLTTRSKDNLSDDKLMKDKKWKKMTSTKKRIKVETWELRAEDLRIIVQGIEKIMKRGIAEDDVPDDSDADIGKDGYSGPRVDLYIKAKKKSYEDVPFGVLQKCLPSATRNYEKGLDPGLAGPLTEGKQKYHHLHKEYRLYESDNHIVAIFEDNSRLVFEVHYHDKRGIEEKQKHRHRAFSKWRTLANEIHRDVQLSEAGNPQEKSWRQCFEEALKHPDLEEFIRDPKKHHRVYPTVDSVNFTPRV